MSSTHTITVIPDDGEIIDYAEMALKGEGGTPVQFQQAAIAPQGGSAYGEFVSAAINLPPRDLKVMLGEAKRVGQLLGDGAFYSWTQSGSTIEGASIGLAYALAQVWGRCVTRTTIISESGKRVHLRGIYVDLQTLTVTERDYIAHLAEAPGKYKDKPDQIERWRVMQLQAASSKAVRGAILGGMPAWFTDAAMQAATRVVREGALRGQDGKPITLDVAKANAVANMERAGLSRAETEAIIGQPFDLWAIDDLVVLRSLVAKLKSGEATPALLRAQIEATQERKAAESSKPSARTAFGLDRPAAQAEAPRESTPAPAEERPVERAAPKLTDKAVDDALKAAGLTPARAEEYLTKKRADWTADDRAAVMAWIPTARNDDGGAL